MRKTDFGATPQPARGTKTTKSLGKNSRQQHLGSPHSGIMPTLARGDPMSRMMGQNGKKSAPPADVAPMRGRRAGMGGSDAAPTAATPGNYAVSGGDVGGAF